MALWFQANQVQSINPNPVLSNVCNETKGLCEVCLFRNQERRTYCLISNKKCTVTAGEGFSSEEFFASQNLLVSREHGPVGLIIRRRTKHGGEERAQEFFKTLSADEERHLTALSDPLG
jgi:hypothetical protein